MIIRSNYHSDIIEQTSRKFIFLPYYVSILIIRRWPRVWLFDSKRRPYFQLISVSYKLIHSFGADVLNTYNIRKCAHFRYLPKKYTEQVFFILLLYVFFVMKIVMTLMFGKLLRDTSHFRRMASRNKIGCILIIHEIRYCYNKFVIYRREFCELLWNQAKNIILSFR